MLAIEYKQLVAIADGQGLLGSQLELSSDHMTTMRCPICDSFIEADGEAPLTAVLRAHLSSVHDLHPDRDVLSSVETFEHRPQLWEGMKRGTVPTDQPVGEDVEESILCPFCGDRFYGHDGEELTQRLKAHFQDIHGIRSQGRSLTMVR